MPSFRQAFADNLTAILTKKEMSQSDFAKAMDVSFQSVNAWVNQRADVSVKLVRKAAEILEIDETDLTSAPAPAAEDRLAQLEQKLWRVAEAASPQTNAPPRVLHLMALIPADHPVWGAVEGLLRGALPRSGSASGEEGAGATQA